MLPQQWSAALHGRTVPQAESSASRNPCSTGGAKTSYTYDKANHVTTQTSTRGQSLTYTYDTAGQLASVKDNILNQTTTYAYDRAGQHVRETTTQGGVIYQDNYLGYDTVGRLAYTADREVYLVTSYDKAGNRSLITTRRIDSTAGIDQTVNRYFLYDAMNRIKGAGLNIF